MFIAVLAAVTASIGTVLIIGSDLKISADSGPLLRTLFDYVILNTFLWAAVILLFAAFLWSRLDYLLALETAKHTRFSSRTIRRLAAEAKSTDGTVRLRGSTDHSRNQLKAKLLRVFLSDRELTDERPGHETVIQTSAATDSATALEAPENGGALDDGAAKDVVADSDAAPENLPARPEDVDSDTDADSDSDVDADESSTKQQSATRETAASFREQWDVMWMDLLTSFNTSEFLWRFVLPASIVFVAALTLLRRAVFRWYVYVVIAAASVFVATMYFGVFKWRRRRRLSSLRTTREPTPWNGCTCLAKRVDTDEATGYYVWISGRLYFDFDAVRLANTVADRWHRYVNGDPVPPAIQEKYARNVKQMLPTVYHTEHDEGDGRPAIMDDIVREVSEATDPHGIVPKHELAERVVERGRDGGHDPDLIAECYADLVPEVLAEREVTVEDTDGNERTLTIVYLRSETVTPQLAQLRSQFSTRVSNESGKYPLPEVPRATIDRENPPAHMRRAGVAE
jgi:hypothetical protein